MDNITKETMKVMKENSNETTDEKQMGVAESIATIKDAIETPMVSIRNYHDSLLFGLF